MKIGIQLPEVEREVRWPEIVAMAGAAEEAGFDSLWVGDHHLYRDEKGERGPWEAWTQLSGLAALTSQIVLGPLVAATAFHPPGMIARMAASIDEISAGRFVLGLGAGWNEPEFRAFGFPFDHTVSRFEDGFEIIRRLLAGEEVTFQGRFHSAEGAVVLPRPGHQIPLMVGSMGSRMLAITLPHVDWWNCWYSWYGNTAAGFAELNSSIDAACLRAGREPGEVSRSACVLAAVDGGSHQRAHETPAVPAERLSQHLQELLEAGADEAVLVLDPITEPAILKVGELLQGWNR